MKKKHFNIFVCLAILFLAACAPSPEAIQKAMEQTQAAIPTPTSTPEPTPTNTPVTGKWQTKSETSSEIIYLNADMDVTGWVNNTYRPILIIRCMEKAFDIIIDAGEVYVDPVIDVGPFYYDLETNKVTIKFRFDKGEEFEMNLGMSTNREAVFIDSPEDFLNRMINADELVFGFTPFNSSPVSTTFDLTGLAIAVKPVLEACK